LDSAHAVVLLVHVSENSEVPVLSPGWSPRILDGPIVNSIIGTITNEENGVVDGGSTPLGDDSVLVPLESGATGVNTDRDWAEKKSLGELLRVESRHLREAGELHISSLSLSCALVV